MACRSSARNLPALSRCRDAVRALSLAVASLALLSAPASAGAAHPADSSSPKVSGQAPAGAKGAGAPAAPTSPANRSASKGIFVFPFENLSEDRSLYWIGEAIADGLLREIVRNGGEVLDRLDRLDVLDGLGVPPQSALTLASQIRAAEDLGAGYLLTGDFSAKDGSLSVRARVVDIAAGRTGAWSPVSGRVSQIFALQRDLFSAVRRALPPPAGGTAEIPAGAGGSAEDGAPQPAYEFLLKSWFEDEPKKKEFLLRRALDIAPDYLRAQIEIALLYQDGGQIDKAAGSLARIVTRDRGLAAEAERLLAEIEMQRDHPEEAESALRRSLASKETARAHLLLARIALARSDRTLARTELARARELDPADPDLREIEEELAATGK